jgi:hypothetical protein
MARGWVEDGTLADSSSQSAGIWRVREGITEALVRRGECETLLAGSLRKDAWGTAVHIPPNSSDCHYSSSHSPC